MKATIHLKAAELLHGSEQTFTDVKLIQITTKHGSFQLRENGGLLDIIADYDERWSGGGLYIHVAGSLLVGSEPKYYESSVQRFLEQQKEASDAGDS